MKKILFMLGSYYDKPFANGICTNKLVVEFKKKGYDVDVLCYSNVKHSPNVCTDNEKIYFVKNIFSLRLLNYYSEKIKNGFIKSVAKKIALLIYRIKKILFYYIFGIVSPIYYLKYRSKAYNLMKNEKYDIVISVYNPVEAILSGLYIKNKFNSVKFVMYTLDTLTNKKREKNLKYKLDQNIGYKIEKKVYDKADLIVNMRCHENHYNNKRYDKYKNKMIYLDIPLICNNVKSTKNADVNNYLKKDKINCVYSGSIHDNPKYICDFFVKLNAQNEKMNILFFTRGIYTNLLKKYEENSKGLINIYDYINHEALMNVFSETKYFISMESRNSDMISSKVLEYMSTGKPIIHFYSSNEDVMLRYLKKYENALLLNQNDDITTNLIKATDFLENTSVISMESIKKIFKENTASYAVNEILSNLK